MTKIIEKGTWAEIHAVILDAAERAPQIPEDNRKVPYEMRAKGYLLQGGKIGEEVEIVTTVNRTLKGILSEVNPAYTHGFGAPISELLNIGAEVKTILREKGQIK